MDGSIPTPISTLVFSYTSFIVQVYINLVMLYGRAAKYGMASLRRKFMRQVRRCITRRAHPKATDRSCFTYSP